MNEYPTHPCLIKHSFSELPKKLYFLQREDYDRLFAKLSEVCEAPEAAEDFECGDDPLDDSTGKVAYELVRKDGTYKVVASYKVRYRCAFGHLYYEGNYYRCFNMFSDYWVCANPHDLVGYKN